MRATRRGAAYLLAPICALTIIYLSIAVLAASRQPLGRVVGYDFAVYVSAARVVHSDGNPYDARAVWSVERRLQGLGSHAPEVTLARVAEPPMLFWALQPIAALPFSVAILIGEALSLLSVVAGLLLLLRSFGSRRWVLPLLAGLALPPTLTYVYGGNVGTVIFGGLALGLLVARRYPFVAGTALSLAIVKPQLALPLAGLVVLFHTSSRYKSIAGFAVGAAGILGASAVFVGPQSIVWWLHGFQSFGSTIRHQPPAASLAALYMTHVPHHVALLLTGALLLFAAAATGFTFWRLRDVGPISVRSLAWLWLLWFLVAPPHTTTSTIISSWPQYYCRFWQPRQAVIEVGQPLCCAPHRSCGCLRGPTSDWLFWSDFWSRCFSVDACDGARGSGAGQQFAGRYRASNRSDRDGSRSLPGMSASFPEYAFLPMRR